MNATETVEHTPGPWSLHPYQCVGEIPADEEKGQPAWRHGDLYIGHGDRIVASVQMHTLPAPYAGYPSVDTEAERDANLNLILAAPDLLASLREFLALYNNTIDMVSEPVKAKLERARAAVSKAEGRL